MNLLLAFEKRKSKQYLLIAKQRLLVLVAIGVTAISITMYATTSEVTVESTPPGNNSLTAAHPLAKSVIPSMGNSVTPVNQAEQTMRDPFARPPEITEPKNDITRALPFIQNNIPSHVPATMAKQIVPSRPSQKLKLTGIVGNAERRLAVIMSASKSQSYSLNDVIGTYKIVAIHDDSVILTNATGKLVLRLESAGLKGGS